MQWPKDNYIGRVLSADFGPAKSSGDPMITLETEVIAPSSIEIDGEPVSVAGQQVKTYHKTQVLVDGVVDMEATAKLRGGDRGLDKLCTAFGIKFEDVNWENPDLELFRGKLQHIAMWGKKEEERKSPTAEQLKRGEKGTVMINPITKQPKYQFFPQISEFYGLATEDDVTSLGGTKAGF